MPRPDTPGSSERWDDIQISPAGDPLPLLPDGELVDVIVTGCRVSQAFDGSWRAMLTCDLLTADGQPREVIRPGGEVVPLRLPLYCKLPPRTGRSGPFHRLFRARTHVVAKNHKGEALPKELQHSVITEFIL